MNVLVITQCSNSKANEHHNQLTLQDFQQGRDHVTQRERELADRMLMLPASKMYTGPQHVRLMKGIKASTETSNVNVDLRIISAGYGLICGSQNIAPYEATFVGMKRGELREWAATLRIPVDFKLAVATAFDLGIILLGETYGEACGVDETVRFGGITIAFCGAEVAKRLEHLRLENLRVVRLPITKNDRSLNNHFSCRNDELKGELAARLLKNVSAGTVRLTELADEEFDVLGLLRQVPA